MCPIMPQPAPLTASVALVIAALEKNRELARAAGCAGFDPLSAVAISGEIPVDRSSLFADYVDAAFWLREHAPSFVPFLASGHAWNMAGGSAVQELAFTLAAGVAYWRALCASGHGRYRKQPQHRLFAYGFSRHLSDNRDVPGNAPSLEQSPCGSGCEARAGYAPSRANVAAHFDRLRSACEPAARHCRCIRCGDWRRDRHSNSALR